MKFFTASRLYLINKCLCSPLEAVFTLLIFILSKDAGATLVQVGVLMTCKPIVSLLAFYINLKRIHKKNNVRFHLIQLTIVGCLPCLFFSFFQNPWYYILAFVFYTVASRASFPVWCEILKIHTDVKKMSRLVSLATSLHYAILIFLPLTLSFWMDQEKDLWKIFFSLLASFQLLNIIFLSFLPFSPSTDSEISRLSASCDKRNLKKELWEILKKDLSFTHYLCLFFLGGVGILFVQSILPFYFTKVLALSYKQLTMAFSLLKGLSFITASPLWARYVNHVSLYQINFFMNLFTCLFILCLIASSYGSKEWIFLGYMMYGTMQAGCEMSWNLSGPLFSKDKESTLYSGLNLALVGLRGCLCPGIGQLIFFYAGVQAVFVTAFSVSLISVIYALRLDFKYKKTPIYQS